MKRRSLAVGMVTNATLISVLDDIFKGRFPGLRGYGLTW